MTGNAAAPGGSHGHRTLRLAGVVGIVVLLSILGTYWTTETFGSVHSPAPTTIVNHNQTSVIYRNNTVYHNSTLFQNTTQNLTTPVYHNSTVWQNSTYYQNTTNTIYRNTTVYVNTTQVVMVPVVNVTGIGWVFSSTGHFAGTTSAELIAPEGDGFVHSYPLGTVMWIMVNVTNGAKTTGTVNIGLDSPFFLCDSQPAVVHAIAAETTMTFELSIGVPYVPGQYTMVIDVAVN